MRDAPRPRTLPFPPPVYSEYRYAFPMEAWGLPGGAVEMICRVYPAEHVHECPHPTYPLAETGGADRFCIFVVSPTGEPVYAIPPPRASKPTPGCDPRGLPPRARRAGS